MSASLIAAIADTLLPREASPPLGMPALPNGSAIMPALTELQSKHTDIIIAIARLAGGDTAFVHASDQVRSSVLEAAEQAMPVDFRALLVDVLQVYYAHPGVLEAMGWRSEPPQPLGHPVEPTDDATLALLDAVRARGPIWR